MWRTLYFKYLCVNYTGNNLLLYNFKKVYNNLKKCFLKQKRKLKILELKKTNSVLSYLLNLFVSGSALLLYTMYFSDQILRYFKWS